MLDRLRQTDIQGESVRHLKCQAVGDPEDVLGSGPTFTVGEMLMFGSVSVTAPSQGFKEAFLRLSPGTAQIETPFCYGGNGRRHFISLCGIM
jgi:hypothetical protein